MTEPYFYARFFLPWVQGALQDKSRSDDIRKKQLEGVIG